MPAGSGRDEAWKDLITRLNGMLAASDAEHTQLFAHVSFSALADILQVCYVLHSMLSQSVCLSALASPAVLYHINPSASAASSDY